MVGGGPEAVIGDACFIAALVILREVSHFYLYLKFARVSYQIIIFIEYYQSTAGHARSYRTEYQRTPYSDIPRIWVLGQSIRDEAFLRGYPLLLERVHLDTQDAEVLHAGQRVVAVCRRRPARAVNKVRVQPQTKRVPASTPA